MHRSWLRDLRRDRRAAVLLTAAGISASACSLTAPPDDELMGRTRDHPEDGGTGDGGASHDGGPPDGGSAEASDGSADAAPPGCSCSLATEVCAPADGGEHCVAPAAVLDGQRWQLDCGSYHGTNPVNNSCWILPPGAPESASSCPASGYQPVNEELTFGGEAGKVYEVTLRFRGIVEGRTYIDGRPDGSYFYVGGHPASSTSNYNTYQLSVSNPPQTYYLNATNAEQDRILAFEYERTIPIRGQATVTLSAFTKECGALRNCEDISTLPDSCVPVPVPNEPSLAAFNGQIIVMAVRAVREQG